MLEPETTLTEVDLAGQTGVDHPVQGAVDGRAADAMIFPPDEVNEIVSAQVSLLSEEHRDDEIAFARTLRPGRTQPIEIGEAGSNAHRLLRTDP